MRQPDHQAMVTGQAPVPQRFAGVPLKLNGLCTLDGSSNKEPRETGSRYLPTKCIASMVKRPFQTQRTNTQECGRTTYLRVVDDTVNAVIEANHLGVLKTHRVDHTEKRHGRVQVERLLGNP